MNMKHLLRATIAMLSHAVAMERGQSAPVTSTQMAESAVATSGCFSHFGAQSALHSLVRTSTAMAL